MTDAMSRAGCSPPGRQRERGDLMHDYQLWVGLAVLGFVAGCIDPVVHVQIWLYLVTKLVYVYLMVKPM
eukprot:6214544-Pleurochrysis_carterae.AAC.1